MYSRYHINNVVLVYLTSKYGAKLTFVMIVSRLIYVMNIHC